MIESKPSWYVVQTHANAEVKAATHLGRQGFEVYLPRFLKRRRHARRVEIVPAALFPRYLFVADIASQRWRSIHSTIGVCRLLCNGDCQSALDRAPLSASKRDPFERRVRPVALAPSELAGVAETARARACA